MGKAFLTIFALILVGGPCVRAQMPDRTPTQAEESSRQIRERQRAQEYFESMESVLNPDAHLPLPTRPPRTGKIKLSQRDRELIAMDAADKAEINSFLKLPETGFVRLHNSAECPEQSDLIDASAPCPWNVPGKAGFYSFRTQDYSIRFFSDLQFEGDDLKIAGLYLLGFLTEMEDGTDIRDLGLASPGIREMAAFEPSVNAEEVQKQFAIAKNGFRVEDHIYKTALAPAVGKTYALRAIAYRGNAYWKVGEKKFNPLEKDKRRDVIVVFRVIRKHEDGSISLLWKKLQEKEAPRLEGDD
ncbi:MAG: hypothetical protein R2747_23480 [Pyrinomonadaceae bacterium]